MHDLFQLLIVQPIFNALMLLYSIIPWHDFGFSFLWSILAVNAIGMIILIDNSRPDPRADLKMYLDAFAKYLTSIPCVIGVGRIDTNPHPNIDEYADLLALRNLPLPVIDVDVRQREDVILMIDMLLAQIEVNMMELGNA